MGERESNSERARTRAELRDWLPAVVLIVGIAVIDEGGLFGSDGTASAAWSLATLVPAVLIAWAVARGVTRADEFQRTFRLVAMAVALGFLLLALYLSLLLDAHGFVELRRAVQASFSGALVVWIVAQLVGTRRWR